MRNINQRVAIIGGMRIPFVKSFKEYARTTNQEMLTATLQAVVRKYNLSGKRLGDVAMGAVMKSSLDWNLSREVVLGTDLDPRTPAFNVQKACGTSLETINLIALKIAAGQIEAGVAGGRDTKNDLPGVVKRGLGRKRIGIKKNRNSGARFLKFFK